MKRIYIVVIGLILIAAVAYCQEKECISPNPGSITWYDATYPKKSTTAQTIAVQGKVTFNKGWSPVGAAGGVATTSGEAWEDGTELYTGGVKIFQNMTNKELWTFDTGIGGLESGKKYNVIIRVNCTDGINTKWIIIEPREAEAK